MKRAMRIFLSFVFPLFSSKCVAFDFLENAEKQQNFEKFFFTAQTEEICARNKDTYLFETRETFEREKREKENTQTRGNGPFLLKRKEEKKNDII